MKNSKNATDFSAVFAEFSGEEEGEEGKGNKFAALNSLKKARQNALLLLYLLTPLRIFEYYILYKIFGGILIGNRCRCR